MAVVLICDVPSPYRDAIERALEASGHRTRTAKDAPGLIALLRADQGRADCVILDEAAVGGTAGLYAAAMRVRSAGSPVLAVIARPEPEARAAALQVVDDVVSRPAHLVEVVARAEALLRGRSQPVVSVEERVLEDPTTGLRSRAFLDERVAEEWRRATRYSEPLALLLLGVLNVDPVAPRGPLVERALREAAGALRRALRQIDVLGRFGATELAALLVNTHLAGAITCADRVRKELATAPPSDTRGGGPPITIALGLALYPGKDVTSANELVRLSEQALARARTEGPGSICLIQHQGYLFQGEVGKGS